MKRIICTLTLLASVAFATAGDHRYQSMIYGPLSVYATTNGYTLLSTSAYATNVIATLGDGTTTFYPYATNSTSGGIYPSWSKPITWTGAYGSPITSNDNLAFTVTMKTIGTALTNTVAFIIGKSVDGENWDTTTTAVSAYSMAGVPSSYTTYTASIADPSVYNGAKYLKLQSITIGTNNSVSASAIVVKDFGIGGYAP